jgi:hypothetical protein
MIFLGCDLVEQFVDSAFVNVLHESDLGWSVLMAASEESELARFEIRGRLHASRLQSLVFSVQQITDPANKLKQFVGVLLDRCLLAKL